MNSDVYSGTDVESWAAPVKDFKLHFRRREEPLKSIDPVLSMTIKWLSEPHGGVEKKTATRQKGYWRTL